MPDPLQEELLKRSWANPANRPPRDTSALINRRNKTPMDAPAMQRLSIEDILGVSQPRSPNGGLPIDLNGNLLTTSDPNEQLQHMLDHPELYQDDIDDLKANDEDATDNADQDPQETLMRLLMNRVVKR